MEVHNHPHHVTHKKKWGEYFLEFFMLFLAVFLGFVAENLREHFADQTKEREYMIRMIADLKADTASISMTVNYYTSFSRAIDTILKCLKSDRPDALIINNNVSEEFWKYAGYIYNNETIQQLKNSGNFRLISNKAVADSILRYDNLVNSFVINQYNDLKSTLFSYKDAEAKVLPYSELKPTDDKLFDSSDFKNVNEHTFITQDKALIAAYYNKLFIHGKLCHLFIVNLGNSKKRATRLISFIRKEYQIE